AREAALGPADLAGRGTRPAGARLHRLDASDAGAGFDVRGVADAGSRQQRAAGADARLLAHDDVADVDDVAVHPVPGDVGLRFDGAVVAELDEPGDRRQRVQGNALA